MTFKCYTIDALGSDHIFMSETDPGVGYTELASGPDYSSLNRIYNYQLSHNEIIRAITLLTPNLYITDNIDVSNGTNLLEVLTDTGSAIRSSQVTTHY